MQLGLIIISVLLISSTHSYNWSYDDSTLYDCKEDSQYTNSEKSDILKLYPIDAIFFVILGYPYVNTLRSDFYFSMHNNNINVYYVPLGERLSWGFNFRNELL